MATVGDRERERELAAHYDQDAPGRASRGLVPQRARWRDEFARQLAVEGRRQILEVGTGPGHDAAALQAAGFTVTGVDLSTESLLLARAAGVDVVRASVLGLPFRARRFDACWTMSTLIHVANAELDAAMAEIVRVVEPGSPLAIGLWGGADAEGPSDFDTISPPRFLSIRSDEVVRSMLEPFGRIERFVSCDLGDEHSLHYQWLVVRTSPTRRRRPA